MTDAGRRAAAHLTGRRPPSFALAIGVVTSLLSSMGCGVRVPPVTDVVPPLRTVPAPVASGSAAQRFGALFCETLTHNPDGGSWGYCAQYLSLAGTPTPFPAGFDDRYRILVVPGIFGQCVEDYARPFEDAKRHLLTHNLHLEYVPVTALGSAEYNAKQIDTYIDTQFAGADQRLYIVIGYSKGTTDVLQALVDFPRIRPRIKAVLSVAGSVLGSRLTQGVPRNILEPLRDLKLGPCEIGDGGGIDSMRRAERAKSIAQLPQGTPFYSIAAASGRGTTSAVLNRGWRTLLAFSLEQDSQMIHEDAIIPGGQYLGMALGDHWAVALPFEHVEVFHPTVPKRLVKLIERLVDRNHYPRVALVEAALRHILSELP